MMFFCRKLGCALGELDRKALSEAALLKQVGVGGYRWVGWARVFGRAKRHGPQGLEHGCAGLWVFMKAIIKASVLWSVDVYESNCVVVCACL